MKTTRTRTKEERREAILKEYSAASSWLGGLLRWLGEEVGRLVPARAPAPVPIKVRR